VGPSALLPGRSEERCEANQRSCRDGRTNGFFKGAFAHRRCLIPADGFYEPEEDERGEKTGRWWYFEYEDDRPFSFAGVWETWGEGQEYLETFTLITTDVMDVVSQCGHGRSPLIFPAEKYDLWLDPEAKPPQLKKLLAPGSSAEIVCYPVDGRAKNPRAAGPELIEPELSV
jgi:putative SOS response-associated peptidase YedK